MLNNNKEMKIREILQHVQNLLYKLGEFAEIIPIFKKENIREWKNHSDISLLSVASKLSSSILKSNDWFSKSWVKYWIIRAG